MRLCWGKIMKHKYWLKYLLGNERGILSEDSMVDWRNNFGLSRKVPKLAYASCAYVWLFLWRNAPYKWKCYALEDAMMIAICNMQKSFPAGEDDNNFVEGMTTDLIFWLCGENQQLSWGECWCLWTCELPHLLITIRLCHCNEYNDLVGEAPFESNLLGEEL